MSAFESEDIEKYSRESISIMDKFSNMDEQNTKRKLIDPLLQILGWDMMYDLELEYSIQVGSNTQSVDYALVSNSEPVLFVETKKLYKNLSDSDANQLESYMKLENVEWGLLTNGNSFEVYKLKPTESGYKSERTVRFQTSDIEECKKHFGLISKEKITDKNSNRGSQSSLKDRSEDDTEYNKKFFKPLLLNKYFINGTKLKRNKYKNLESIFAKFLDFSNVIERRSVIPEDNWTVLEMAGMVNKDDLSCDESPDVYLNSRKEDAASRYSNCQYFINEDYFEDLMFDKNEFKKENIRSRFKSSPYIYGYKTDKYATVYYDLTNLDSDVIQIESFKKYLNQTLKELYFRENNHPANKKSIEYESTNLAGYISNIRVKTAMELIESLLLLTSDIEQFDLVNPITKFDNIDTGSKNRELTSSIENSILKIKNEKEKENPRDTTATKEEIVERIDKDEEKVEDQIKKLARKGELYQPPGKEGYYIA